jgi:hypothetical protein
MVLTRRQRILAARRAAVTRSLTPNAAATRIQALVRAIQNRERIANMKAKRIGQVLNKRGRGTIAVKGTIPKAKGGPRKVRSNKGVKRGPRPATIEKRKLAQAAKNAAKANKNAMRMGQFLNKRGRFSALDRAVPKAKGGPRKVRSNKGTIRPATIEKRKIAQVAKNAAKANKNAMKAMKIAKAVEAKAQKKLNTQAKRIGKFLNKQGRRGTIAVKGAIPKAKSPSGPRKVRSNKGVKRGPRPATVEKLLEKANKSLQTEANRLNRVLGLIKKRRSLTRNQKDRALINAAKMSAKNLRAKYIIVQKREKKAMDAVKNAVKNAAPPAAKKSAKKRRSANANIAAQKVMTTGRRSRSTVNNLN